MNLSAPKSAFVFLALCAVTPLSAAVIIIGTESTAWSAVDYSVAGDDWTSLADTETSPSINPDVMVFRDDGGIDSATDNNSNNSVNAATSLSFELDFTATGSYYLYVRAQGEFSDVGQNDSFFLARTDIDAAVGTGSNFTQNGNFEEVDASTAYFWFRAGDDRRITETGTGVQIPTAGGNWDGSYVITQEDVDAGALVFTIVGREPNLQIDQFVLSTNPLLTATELDSLSLAAIPEPSTLALMGIASLVLLVGLRRRH